MKYWMIVLPLVFFAYAAHADEPYEAVQYSCDAAANRLTLEYLMAQNEEGRAMVSRLGPDGWDPETLVKRDADGNVVGMTEVHRTCILSDGAYEVAVGPRPGNANVQGTCGAAMTAWARVTKDSVTLVERNFEGWCMGEDPIVRKLEVHAGGGTPQLVTEFYRRHAPTAEFMPAVRYHCDSSKKSLTLEYEALWSDIRGMNTGMDEWTPASLLIHGSDDEMTAVPVERTCQLGDVDYAVTVEPLLMENTAGCEASYVSATVTIQKNGAALVERDFEESCEPSAEVITRIEINPGSARPRITTVPRNYFYQP